MAVEITELSPDIKIPDNPDTIEDAVQNPMSTMRALVKNDLFLFLQYFWPEYSQDTFKPNWHIKYICKELEEAARRVARGEASPYDIIINVPPGSSKTAIVSIMYPLWCWTNWFWMRFITAAYTAALSLESAEYSREIMRSERFKALFPELDIKQDKDAKSNFRVVRKEWHRKGSVPRVTQGGNRLSTSVGGTLTGFHGHINIVDDPIDPNRAISDVEVKKANHWMDNTLPFRKVDKSITPTILIMQRLHQDDPTGHLLDLKADKIKHICIPGEIRNYKDKVKPPDLVGFYQDDLMDPTRLNWDVLNNILDLGQFTYGGQIGQDPIPLGGGMFRVDFISTVESVTAKVVQTVRYWDKAATPEDGAFTVGVKMCKTSEGKFVVMDVKRGQWDSDTREKIIKQTAEADGKHVRVYVEQEPGSGGKESAQATIKNLAGFSVWADRPTGDKVLRADPYSVQVNAGQVQILRAPWNEKYLDEMENFPASTFKDQVDASSGAFAQLVKRRKVGVITR